jgi:hypothetical protein
MKNKSIFLFAFALLSASLIAHQDGFGLNLTLIGFMLLGLSVFLKKDKDYTYWLSLGIAIAGSLSPFLHMSSWWIAAYFFGIGQHAILFHLNKGNPVIGTLIWLFQWVTAPIFIILHVAQRDAPVSAASAEPKHKKVYWLIPLSIGLVFLFIYAGSSLLVKDYLDRINLDFLDGIWLFTFVLCLFAGYSFLYLKINDSIGRPFRAMYGQPKESKEKQWGATIKATLITLCAILLFVILVDFYHRFIIQQLPIGVTLSEYLHQGFFPSLVSVALSSILMLVTTHKLGNQPTRDFRILFYIYSCLNILFILQNVHRNYSYIQEFAMSESRIYVYFSLLFWIAAVAFTLFAVLKKEAPFPWLASALSHILVYGVIILSLWNRNAYITSFNVAHAMESSRPLDESYLFSLLPYNLERLEDEQMHFSAKGQHRIQMEVEHASLYSSNKKTGALQFKDVKSEPNAIQ